MNKVYKERYHLIVLLVIVLAHAVPVLGIFIDNIWLKYGYIVGSYAIGCVFIIITNKWYIRNTEYKAINT